MSNIPTRAAFHPLDTDHLIHARKAMLLNTTYYTPDTVWFTASMDIADAISDVLESRGA